MARFTDSDSDEARLPEGMTRIGYDADSQRYTFRDSSDGSLWESAPGNRFGELRPVGYQPTEADVEATNLAIEEDHQSALRLERRSKGKSELWGRPYGRSRAVRKWQLVWYVVRFQRMREQAVKERVAVAVV